MEIKRIRICLIDGEDHYLSKWYDYSEETNAYISKNIRNALTGEISVLVLESENGEYFFPKQIIERSILTIKYE